MSMKFRDPINTESLQKRFPEAYQEFFGRNEMVVSMCLDVPILTDNNTRARGVSIKQKIPIRLYCGISTVLKTENKFWYYDYKNKSFTAYDLRTILPQFDTAIKSLLERMDISDQTISIELLSEANRGMNFGVTAKLSAMLPVLLEMYFLDKTAFTLESNRIIIPSGKQKSLLRLSTQFLNILRKKDLDVGGICTMYSQSTNPDYCIYGRPISDIDELEKPPLDTDHVVHGSLQSYLLAEEVRKFYDIYFIYTGQQNPLISHIEQLQQDQNSIDSPVKEIPTIFPEYDNQYLTTSLYLDYLRLLYNMSFMVFAKFNRFFNHPLSKEKFSGAMRALNQYAIAKESLESEENETFSIVHRFRNLLYQKGLQNVSLIRGNSYKLGGGITIIMESEKNRETVFEIFNEIKQTYSQLEMAYISFIDGFPTYGFCLEKSLKDNLKSIFDRPEQIVLEDWSGHKHFLASIEDLQSLKYDIVLDRIQNKIMINQKKLSSKELHSQKMTIDVLVLLLGKIERDIPNTALPHSSYASNKNEMQGKIILPMTKLILEKTGKKMLLTCKGTNTRYYLRLSKSDLNLGVLYTQ